jgi:carboxymethylenebutenolidase
MKALLLSISAAALCSTALAQNWATTRLENSPRHGEWVKIRNAGREISCFIVYPETKAKAPAVLVVHEIFGLTDWVRGVCDQLAKAGVIALAPDFLSGMRPKDATGDTFSGVDEARKAISSLPTQQVMSDLDAAFAYLKALPAGNGEVAVAGFCWGGAKAFEYAAHQPQLAASYVFYGTGPDHASGADSIKSPVFGFYAGNDARVNETLPKTTELMKAAGKEFDPRTYDGAGHGFMRAGEAPDASEANRKAREDAWTRWKELLKRLN